MLKLILMSVMLTTGFAMSIYDFKVDGLNGKPINLGDYKGKYMLIVNTASKCGYTKQYEGLQKLYEAHGDKLVIIGFPANNFGGQEPGTNQEIQEFCKLNYGVTFPMAAKVSVKGKDIHPLFKWLTNKDENKVMDADIRWNFTKFLIDPKGKLIAKFDSAVEPMSDEIVQYLK